MTPVDRFTARYRGLSEPLRSERRLELLLLGVALLALVQCLWIGWRSLSPPALEAVLPAAAGLQAAAPPETVAPDASQRLELQSRPLFWVSRRPQQPALVDVVDASQSDASPAPKAAPALRGLVLNGVFGGAARGGAIVTYRGESTRLRVGDALDGWTLVRAGNGAAVFDSEGLEDVRQIEPLPFLAGASASGASARSRGPSPAPSAPQAAPAGAGPGAEAANPRPRSLSTGGLSAGGVSGTRNEE